MAPSFDQVDEADLAEIENIDFTDLEEKYRDLREEQGFDNWVVLDGKQLRHEKDPVSL